MASDVQLLLPPQDARLDAGAGLGRMPHWRLACVLLVALTLGTAGLLAILAVTGLSLETGFARFVLLALLLLAVAVYCHHRGHDWRLKDSASVAACATIGLLLCGLVSITGLRVGFPLADGMLARSDALAGFDVREVVRFTAAEPSISALLHFAYNSSGLLCIAAAGWSLLAKDRARLWQVVATIVIAMQITALVSVLFPARGAILAFGLNSLQEFGLPPGAGTYSAREFAHFYWGSDTLVMLKDMNGIVTFPSFHTVMALVIMQGFVATQLKWVAIGWSALTIVSTVPMGGHYVTDLAGGLLVWAAAYALAAWACRTYRNEPPSAPVG